MLTKNKKLQIKWYCDLLHGLFKIWAFHKPVPLMCHWEITYKCNLNCLFCVTRFNRSAWAPETTTSQALEILSQLAGMGTKILNIVGGEPTRRNDLPQIIKHARSLGMKIAVTTNGVMDDRRRRWLLDVDIIRVSLEGAPKLNSSLRKMAHETNPTKNAVNTLRFLRKNNKLPIIASTFSAQTQEEDIRYLISIARELGIKINFNPIGIGFSERKENFTPDDREERKKEYSNMILPLKMSLEKISGLHKRYPDNVTSGEPSLNILKMGGLEKFGCRAMDTAICLKPDGSVAIPCIEFPKTVVKKDDLSSVFYGEKAGRARKNQGKYWFCKSCQLTCMISATSLVSLKPLLHLTRQYLPQAFRNVNLSHN